MFPVKRPGKASMQRRRMKRDYNRASDRPPEAYRSAPEPISWAQTAMNPPGLGLIVDTFDHVNPRAHLAPGVARI